MMHSPVTLVCRIESSKHDLHCTEPEAGLRLHLAGQVLHSLAETLIGGFGLSKRHGPRCSLLLLSRYEKLMLHEGCYVVQRCLATWLPAQWCTTPISMPSTSVIDTYMLACKLRTGPAVLGLGRDTAMGQLQFPALQHLLTIAPRAPEMFVASLCRVFLEEMCEHVSLFECISRGCWRSRRRQCY